MIKEYSISGMSCAACSASVERAVRRISGVDAASVNLSTEKLFVRSTNDLSDEIFAAVQKVGFGIAPVVSAKKQSKKGAATLSLPQCLQFRSFIFQWGTW